MRVGVVWNSDAPLAGITVRFERYLQGLRELGHEAFAVCTPPAAKGFAEPTLLAPSRADLTRADFWPPLALDAAFVITWLGMPEVLRALKPSCPWVVSLADSDGIVGVRAHPRETLERLLAMRPGWRLKARGALHWAELLVGAGRHEEEAMIESASLADRIVFGAERPSAHFARFLTTSRRPDLLRKLRVVMYPVDRRFLDSPVRREREDAVLAVGRWDDPQKDATLLSAGIAKALDRGARTRFVLIGRGGERWFAPLARRFPAVEYLGVQPPQVIADRLARSRAMVFASRWEGSPVAANEALASGCSLVAPSGVPSLRSFCEAGAGTCFGARRPESVAEALEAEMRAWAAGQRRAEVLAAEWRPRVDPVAVSRALLAERPNLASNGRPCDTSANVRP
jgi:glycosyltransferase involved in cell wall biosynthesis